MRIPRLRAAIVVAAVIVMAVPATASANHFVQWAGAGNWYRSDYGQVFASAIIAYADGSERSAERVWVEGKIRDPCNTYRYRTIDVPGAVWSETATSVSFRAVTTLNSSCAGGIDRPYEVVVSGTHRATKRSNADCWAADFGGVSDMTVTWGNRTTTFLPSYHQFGTICRHGI